MRRSGFTAQGVRAEIKRRAVFFANSRLRDVEMGGGGWKRVALDGNKERFVRKNGFLYVKKAAFENSKKLFEQRCFGCENERLLRAKRQAFCKRKPFVLRKRTAFSAHAKQPDKEKTFFSAQRHRLRTAPKLTCSNTFHLRQPTVSLQYNNSFSKNIGLASALR